MASIPTYDPGSTEAKSPLIAGLSEGLNKISNILNMGVGTLTDARLNNVQITDNDKNRIYQANMGQRLWLQTPAPTFKKNGEPINQIDYGYEIDYVGGSISFDTLHRLQDDDVVTVSCSYIVSSSKTISDIQASIEESKKLADRYKGAFETVDDLTSLDPDNGDFAFVLSGPGVYFWDRKWIDVTGQIRVDIKKAQEDINWIKSNLGASSAAEVTYDDAKTGLGAETVQKAIEKLASTGGTAEKTSYNNKISKLSAENVQGAIDEVNQKAEKVGVPKGGAVGQLIVKSGTEDYKTEWKNPTEAIPYYSNQNLLDNAYFVGGGSQQGGGKFPINQRSSTEYSTIKASAYTIDGWWSIFSNIRIEADGFTFENPGGTEYGGAMRQVINNPSALAGRTLTMSVLCDSLMGDNRYYVNKSYGINSGTQTIISRILNNGLNSITFQVPADVGSTTYPLFVMGLSTPIGGKAKIIAAKLELGDHQTLAHKEGDTWVLNDPPPDYALELLKCQLYQFEVNAFKDAYAKAGLGIANANNSIAFEIVTPTTLYKIPTLVYTGKWRASKCSGDTICAVSSMRVVHASANAVAILANMSNTVVKGEAYIIEADNDVNAKILLDSNP